MEEKYKVFQVAVIQTFDYCWYEHRWFKKKILKTKTYKAYGKEKYILAKTDTEAINIYKRRYKWEFDYPIERLWYWSENGVYEYAKLSETPNFKHEVGAVEKHPSFEFLKKHLRAEDLLAFCKQEMYPVEVFLKSEVIK